MSRRKRSLKIGWRQTWPIWLIFGFLFGFGLLGVWLLAPGTHSPTKVLAQGQDINVATADLVRGEPQVFAMPLVAGDKAEFLIERGMDENVTVAFASCRRCYRSGHYRQGDQIFCGRCNEPMVRLGRSQTPTPEIDCTLIPIPFERAGENVIVRASAVNDAFAQWYMPIVSKDKPDSGRK
jgi:hypothetical protein